MHKTEPHAAVLTYFLYQIANGRLEEALTMQVKHGHCFDFVHNCSLYMTACIKNCDL